MRQERDFTHGCPIFCAISLQRGNPTPSDAFANVQTIKDFWLPIVVGGFGLASAVTSLLGTFSKSTGAYGLFPARPAKIGNLGSYWRD